MCLSWARMCLCFLFILSLDATWLSAAEPLTLRVMSFNLWHGGDAGKQPLEQTAKVIREARADIVGLQETAGVASNNQRPDNSKKIAEILGWHHFDQGGRTGVVSRFPIIGSTPRKWGVKIETRSGEYVWLFNAHFAHAPYQPYQLLGIPYSSGAFLSTASEAIAAAQKARGEQVTRMLAEVSTATNQRDPVFVTGDFNEPSHLDWTAAVAAAKRCPLEVAWPTTKAVMDAGFTDGIRQLHPDPLKSPCYTWTPITSIHDPKDHHDRIDFVFSRGTKVSLKSAEIVGEKKENADIVVTPYPSDHRAVVVEVLIGSLARE